MKDEWGNVEEDTS